MNNKCALLNFLQFDIVLRILGQHSATYLLLSFDELREKKMITITIRAMNPNGPKAFVRYIGMPKINLTRAAIKCMLYYKGKFSTFTDLFITLDSTKIWLALTTFDFAVNFFPVLPSIAESFREVVCVSFS